MIIMRAMFTVSTISRRRRGFSLLEIAIVLGVAGVIMSGVWAAASHITDAQRLSRATQEVAQIVSGFRQMYSKRGIDDVPNAQGWAETTCKGVNAGYFPSEMMNTAACDPSNRAATYPIGAWPTSYVSTAVEPSTRSIIVTYWNLPQNGCIALANALFGGTTGQTREGMDPMGVQLHFHYMPPIVANGVPFTSGEINTYCSGSATNQYWVQVGYAAQ